MKNTNTITTTNNTITKEENTMKNLVNISVLQATSNKDIVKSIVSDISKVEGMAFKVAVKGAYLTGNAIPCGDGTITNSNKMSCKDFYTLVNRSKATLSRWIKAVNLIIEAGLFSDFNAGKYPFSFDKVIIILTDDELKNGNFAELMKLSVSTLQDMTSDNSTEESDETTADETTADDSEKVDFSYNGRTYLVNKSIMEKFIAENCELK